MCVSDAKFIVIDVFIITSRKPFIKLSFFPAQTLNTVHLWLSHKTAHRIILMSMFSDDIPRNLLCDETRNLFS